jgi:phosphopantetheinyl transferase (holo-ACP synthase)
VHAEKLGIARVHISITHDGAYAAAVAIAEKDPG